MKKLLLVQPHSDDILFSTSHALFLPEFEVEVLTVETDPKRAEQDKKLFDFLNIPVHHLGVEFKDESYYVHFKEKGHATTTVENSFATVREHLGKDLELTVETELVEWVREFQRHNPGYMIVAPLGVGHPFHLWVRYHLENMVSELLYYREFPHSYKRRSQWQMGELGHAGYWKYKEYRVEDFDDVKWALAARFYKSQSGLLFYEQGYIKKRLPEEIWRLDDGIPF